MNENFEFHRQLIADVQNEADAEGLINVEAFFEKIADLLTEAGELEGADRCYYEGRAGSSPMQVDGYGGDPREAEGVLSLIICDFEIGEEPRVFHAVDLKSRFGRLKTFLKQCRKPEFRESLEETSSGFGLADLIATTWRQVTKIKLILATNAESRAKKVDSLKAGTLDGKTITYNVWDLRRIQTFMISGQAREELLVDFAGEFGGAVPVLRAFGADRALESYVAVLPGHQLAAVYEKWGSRLLEANVRSFLQARGKVNRGIRDTIREEPDMFFSYNNGITATAEDVVVDDTPDCPVLRAAQNLQIVNGGQTTASIHAALKLAPAQLEHVRVQMKLSVVPPKTAEKVVPKISEFANSQNKVNAADFFSNHGFHIRIEEFSRRVLAPAGDDYKESKWFYERARGQYHDERGRRSPSERKRFDLMYPRRQFFTKTDLAKFENSWSGKPEEVSKGAQKNFALFAKEIGKRWSKSDVQFDETWFKRMIAKAIIFRTLEKLIPKQEWYAGDYRAQVVTYTMAKLACDAAEMDQLIDLDAVWRAQRVGEALERSLLVAAEAAHDVITSPPTGIRNMSEWAKKQACWAELRKRDLEYGPWIMKCLIDPEDAAAVVRSARREVSVDDGIDAQRRVLELGGDFWRAAREWGLARRLLTPTQAGVLATCAQMPTRLPTEKQCAIAVAALHKLEESGYGAVSEAAE